MRVQKYTIYWLTQVFFWSFLKVFFNTLKSWKLKSNIFYLFDLFRSNEGEIPIKSLIPDLKKGGNRDIPYVFALGIVMEILLCRGSA